jgi:putative Ca2+/H+ antiporter (TMEM165/GDT1 family)
MQPEHFIALTLTLSLAGEGVVSRRGADMDWKLIASTFGVIFLAELGDKTQLAALTLSASTQKPLAIFIGASLALVAVSAVGVAVGAGLSEVIPMIVVRKVSAAAFVIIGVAMLLDWM